MKLRIEGRDEPLDVQGDVFTIGRERGVDLLLDDPEVSRAHAELRRGEDGGYELHDARSRNGTQVNGRRIDGPVALRDGDRIRLGDTVLVVEADDPSRTVVGRTAPPPGAAEDRTVVGRPVPRGERPRPAAPGAGGPPPLAPPAQPIPPRRDSPSRVQSRIERARLRKRTSRALVVAGVALVTAATAVVLAVAGVFDSEPAAARTVEDVVAEVTPSTVLVIAHRDGRRFGSGTGWVLDGPQGLIVTNAHVVNGGETFRVGAGGDMHDATVVAAAPCEDLAVLRVRRARDLRTLPLGSQGDLRQGRSVVAVGFPTNAALEDNLTSTAGVISVVRTTFRLQAVDVPRYPNVIQTDAAINPGNSGGPLVDLDGHLVGVNSAGFTLAGGRLIQGQGYAIGVDRVKEIVPRLRRGTSIGWTGAGLEYPDPAELRRDGLPPGLLVSSATEGTSAARAGLGRRPELLLAVDARPVGTTLQTYCRAVEDVESGTEARLTLLGPDGPRNVPVRFE